MPRDDRHIREEQVSLIDRLRGLVLPSSPDIDPQAADEHDPDLAEAEQSHQSRQDAFDIPEHPDMAALQEQRRARDEDADLLKEEEARFAERTGWTDILLDDPPERLPEEDRKQAHDLIRRRLDLSTEKALLERQFDDLAQKSWDRAILPDEERDSADSLRTSLEERGGPVEGSHPGATADTDYKRFLKEAREAFETKLDTRQQRAFVNLIGGRAELKTETFLNDKAVAFLDQHTGLLKIEDRQDNGRRVELAKAPDTKSLRMEYSWRVSEIGGETLAQGIDRARQGAADALGIARDRHRARPGDRHLTPQASPEDRSSGREHEPPEQENPSSGWDMLKDRDHDPGKEIDPETGYEIIDLDAPDDEPGNSSGRNREQDRGDDFGH